MRLASVFILAPAAALAAAVAVANRAPIVVSLDPFSRDAPALVFEAPLYAVILGAILIGLVLGSWGTWVAQGRHRRSTRELRELGREISAAARR